MSLHDSAPHSAPSGGLPSGPALPGGNGNTTDFHRLFPQVPASESVVQEFQCSLSRKKLLRVGRLYVTPVRLCFSSMLVEAVELTWEEVASCDKKTAMLFDQIIVKPTDPKRFGGELCFTGFMNGCSSPFSTIKMLWNVRRKYSKATSDSSSRNASITSASATGASPSGPGSPSGFDHAAPEAPVRQPGLQPPAPQLPEAQSIPASPTAGRTNAGSFDRASPQNTLDAPRSVSPQVAAMTPVANSPRPMSPALGAPEAPKSRTASPQPLPAKRELTMEPAASPSEPHAAMEAGDNGKPVELPNDSFAGENGTPAADDGGNRSRSASTGGAMAGGQSPATAAPTRDLAPPTPEAVRATAIHDSPAFAPATDNAAASALELPRSTTPGVRAESPARPRIPQSPTAVPSPMHRRSRSDGISHPDPSQLQAASASQSDFLRSFPNVPRTESILDSFQCSYVAGVHRLGKMHITGNYLLFYSVMLAEPIVVRLVDIAKIDKLTSLLVLDGLSIILHDGTRYDFTSFISREKAFSMLQQLVSTHLQMKRTLGHASVAGGRPQSPSVQPESSPVPSEAPAVRTAEAFSSVGDLSPSAATATSGGAPTPQQLPSVASSPTSELMTGSAGGASAAGLLPAPVRLRTSTATSTGGFIDVADINELDSVCPTDFGSAMSKPALFLDTPLSEDFAMPVGYTLFDVFHCAFDDDAPVGSLYREFRRDTDVSWEEWRPPSAGAKAAAGQAGQRVMRCQTIIRALIAEKYYPYEELNRYAFLNVAGTKTLVLQNSGQASGVTFSDTFRTESLLVYKETVDPATKLPRVTARHYMYVQFLKFSIVKSKIRSESTKELKEGMRRHNEITAEHLRGAPSSASLGKALSDARIPAPSSGPDGAATTVPHQQPALTSARAMIGASTAPSTLARQDSQQVLAARRGPSHGGPMPASAGGPSILVPEAMVIKMVMAPMLLLALLYTLKAVWNSFWFYPDVVPVLPSSAGATADGADGTALQLLAAANTSATVAAYIVRPALTALVWALGAALVAWIGAMLP